MFQHHDYGTSKWVIHYLLMLVAKDCHAEPLMMNSHVPTCRMVHQGSYQPLNSLLFHQPKKCSTSPPPIPPQADTITNNGQSSFAVVPGKTCKPIAFISDSWVTDMSLDYHFKLAFTPSYPIGTMVSCHCITLSPMGLAAVDEHVLIAYSNNDGRKMRDQVKVDHLKPADINKATSGLQIVVLIDEKKGQIFYVKSTQKKQRICILHLGDDLFEEQWC